MTKAAVLGAGAWGTAISCVLAARLEVTLWARDAAQAASVGATRRNERYLPGFELPSTVQVTADLAEATRGAELLLAATPVAGLRSLLDALATPAPLVWLCKGFEEGTGELPHQIARAALGSKARFGALSGPSFAEEVARGLPCALTLASGNATFAREAAAMLHGGRMRVYYSSDLVGVEIGGAVKNVMAIAAGISDGMGLGLNARAALITRGLAEIVRLGAALGGQPETFMGLAGAGDLILTATGDLSRNRRVGLELARGRALGEIVATLGHVAEGVHSAREVAKLAARHRVEMPVSEAVCAVLDGRSSGGGRAAARARIEDGALTLAGEAELAPGFEYRDGDCVREIEAAIARPHRQAQPLLLGKLREHIGRQAVRLAAEHQHIIGGVAHIGEKALGARREGEHAAGLHCLRERGPGRMHLDARVFAVVETRALQLLVVEREAERPHQMQARAWVDEDDIKHAAWFA